MHRGPPSGGCNRHGSICTYHCAVGVYAGCSDSSLFSFHPFVFSHSIRSYTVSTKISAVSKRWGNPYIFFPRSASVALPSSRSSASSMRPIWPRSVPSSSSCYPSECFGERSAYDKRETTPPLEGKPPAQSIKAQNVTPIIDSEPGYSWCITCSRADCNPPPLVA